MERRTKCQQAFEVETLTWGLDYEMDENGCYTDWNTGVVFGSFQLGWEAALRRE